ncbi:hypothetical protein GCM10023063_17550 [Arthrobacter methylotrophus]|uniref:Uncharacterized protein n=1 Tax=Arthrobacter methylotrophus TaxID=121291 RepID=A0ABV5UNS3_9MICC
MGSFGVCGPAAGGHEVGQAGVISISADRAVHGGGRSGAGLAAAAHPGVGLDVVVDVQEGLAGGRLVGADQAAMCVR